MRAKAKGSVGGASQRLGLGGACAVYLCCGVYNSYIRFRRAATGRRTGRSRGYRYMYDLPDAYGFNGGNMLFSFAVFLWQKEI